MPASRLFRQWAPAFFVLCLAACGGGGSSNNAATYSASPLPNVRYAATVPVSAVATLDGSGSTTTSGRALTYSWTLVGRPSGSAAALGSPTAVQTTLPIDVIGVYLVTLTVSDGVNAQSVTVGLTAVAYTAPTILADLVEPVSGTVQLSLSSDPGGIVTWTVDGATIGTGASVSWITTGFANGSHVVIAHMQAPSSYAVDASRTIQVRQTTVSFTSATISQSTGTFTAIVGAQSVNGIVRVDATLDGVAFGSLAAPNACVDPTGAACASTGPNGYQFSGTAASGQHVVVVWANDGIGNYLGTQLRIIVP